MRGTVDLTDFDPFGHDTQQAPHRFYAAMRRECPVFHHEETSLVFVTRHEDILRILRDPATFSSRFGISGGSTGEQGDEVGEIEHDGWPAVPTLLTNDPPGHDRLRRLVSKAFTPRQVARLEPDMIDITNSLIDSFIDDGRCEFVSQFAVGLPVTVIARALNVAEDRLDDFKRWSDDSTAAIGSMVSIERRLEAAKGIREFQYFFAAALEQREVEPQDDLLSGLNKARLDEPGDPEGSPLSMAEKLGILQQLLVAGNETTTKLLTESMRLLAEHPAEWRALQADPTRAAPVVEECLRLASPTQGMFRVLTADTEIAGVPVRAGTTIVVVFASANRDETVFGGSPDDFEPDRDHLSQHLAFGKGLHFCVGANLARLEAVHALSILSRRLETISLADPEDIEYEPSFVLRGMKRLALDFTPM